MPTPYRLMYRVGITPWDRDRVPMPLNRLVEGTLALPAGRALDVGCGTGRQAVYLARRGWRVTGVDLVDAALARARQRSAREGVEVDWVRGDVGKLGRQGLEPGYTLLYDIGCFHGLSDPARDGAAAGLTELAAPGATLLLLGFSRGRRVVVPRGIDRSEMLRRFGDAWELIDSEPERDPTLPRLARRARPAWYRLTRKS